MRALALLAGLWTSGVACAAPSDPVVDSDGYVRVEMDVAHSTDAVRSYLSNAGQTMRLGRDITAVETEKDGECIRMRVTTRGFTRPMSFVARRCPTANGWRSTMLQSDDFERHDIEWTAVPGDTGTRVVMRVRVIPRFPVPQLLIRKVVGGALISTMIRLDSLLGGI